MLNPKHFSLGASAALGALALATPPAHALTEQTLHGFCSQAAPLCQDNGTITPTTLNPPVFGFTRSPDSNNNLTTPTFELLYLIPDVPSSNSLLSFTATGTHTGLTTAQTETRFSATAWTSGDLLAYLGLAQTGGPNNRSMPICRRLSRRRRQQAYPCPTGTSFLKPTLGPLHLKPVRTQRSPPALVPLAARSYLG